jgi:hypothetical protein
MAIRELRPRTAIKEDLSMLCRFEIQLHGSKSGSQTRRITR